MSALTDSDKETIRRILEEDWVEDCVRQEWDRCLDAVSEDYVYMVPGPDGEPFEIISYGADGEPDGEGENADISSLSP